MLKTLKKKEIIIGTLILGTFLCEGTTCLNAGGFFSAPQGDWKERMSEGIHRKVVNAGLMSPEEARKSHQKNLDAWAPKPQPQTPPQSTQKK